MYLHCTCWYVANFCFQFGSFTYLVHLQSSSDLPLLVTIRDLSRRLLSSLLSTSSPSSPNIQPTNYPSPLTATTPQQLLNHPPTAPQTAGQHDEFRIGFITPPFKDSKIPVTDHLHAHAYILPADRMGWWRSVGFGPLAWYSIEDLIAEIRYVIALCSSYSHYFSRQYFYTLVTLTSVYLPLKFVPRYRQTGITPLDRSSHSFLC